MTNSCPPPHQAGPRWAGWGGGNLCVFTHLGLWAQAPGPKGWMNSQEPPPGRASLAPGHLGPHPKSWHTGPANPDPGHLLPAPRAWLPQAPPACMCWV